ncbi:hypothetical protein EIP91_010454, partial [Steccherinum ochraceum]
IFPERKLTVLVRISSSAARCHSAVVKAAHQRHVLPSHLLSNGQRVHLVASARQFSWSSSRLASNPQSPEKLTQSDSSPPPLILPQRKHKVELKPGPVKPQASDLGSPTTAPTSLQKDSTALQSNTATTPSTSHANTNEGVIEAAKHDYADASQHGNLAPAPEGSSRIYTLYHQAKELFKFYVRGLKLIFTNWRRVREMQERVRTGGPPLTRWETKFIQTSKEDRLKLIPFAMIILIIEEIIPLIVLYAPFILPSTCILPTQKDRIDAKKREKQRVLVQSYTDAFAQLVENAATSPALESTLAGVPMKPLTGLLGLSTFTPSFMQRSALKRHLKLLGEDDALLLREHNGAHLTPSELRRALFERGILTDEVPESLWRSRLDWWLSSVEKASEKSAGDAALERLKLIARSALGRF